MEYAHSYPFNPTFKVLFFILIFFGPSLPETSSTTNPAANKTVIKSERNLTDQIVHN
jgi:hypothetical protein